MELDVLRRRWAAARTGLYALVEQLEAEPRLDFTPFEGARDAPALLRHIAHEEEIEVTWGARRAVAALPPEAPSEESGSPAELRALLQRVHAGTERYLDALTQEQLDAEIETAWEERTRLGDLLWHTLEHELHHRGELSLMLGMLGHEGLQA